MNFNTSPEFAEIMSYKFFDNSVEKILYALGIYILLSIIFKIFRGSVLSKLKTLSMKTATKLDDSFVEAFERMHTNFYNAVALFFAIHYLETAEVVEKFINGALLIIIVLQLLSSFQPVLVYLIHKFLKDENGQPDTTASAGVKLLANIILYTTGILLILSNLGVNITSLAASLGIGGIAIALAVQNILGDIFSSFSIYFDRPFVVGDFIIVGEHVGTVEHIGMKSTRLKALQGEEIVISNKELTSARIQNFKKMEKRRVVYSLGVTYDTSLEKCKEIPNIITNIYSEIENAELGRVNFLEFADFSLVYEIVYYHASGDYDQYMEEREIINLRIKEEFEKANIDMAFPTQTVIMEKN